MVPARLSSVLCILWFSHFFPGVARNATTNHTHFHHHQTKSLPIMMMNRTFLHLLALFLSVLSTSSLHEPANRLLEFELAEYNSHRHWEDGVEKNVYSPPTVAPTQAPANFLPVEGDDDFGPDSTDDAIDDTVLDPSDTASKDGGIGALTSILISAGGVVVVAAAVYLRRKKSDEEEGDANNEGDTAAAPTEDLPSTAADV